MLAALSTRKKLIGFGLVAFYIILDQLSKWWILEHMIKPNIPNSDLAPFGIIDWFVSHIRLPFVSIELLPFFNLTMVWNQGISFGLFQNGNPWPLIILSSAIAIFFSIWLYKATIWREIIPLGLVIGGALGNIIDRLHFGAVADFIDFHIADWHYPAFNLADSFITVGIAILVINSLFFTRS